MAIDPETAGSKGQDSYLLSSMQESMLHTGQTAAQAGLDIEQVIGELHEPLDVSAFEKAWQRVVQRHGILRTAFEWRDLPAARQKIFSTVPLDFEFKNFRSLSAAERQIRWAAWLQADRQKGFNLNSPPLMRVAVFRLGQANYRFVWTFHHLLLDATAFTIVLRELFAFYEAFREGFDLELNAPTSFREHIDWLGRQNFDAAEPFWRPFLKGFEEPTPLTAARTRLRQLAEAEETHGEQSLRLSSAETSALEQAAASQDVRLSTLVEAGWGLLLGRYSGREDVVFGTVRACRSSANPGAQTIVGLLINTLPMRLQIDPQMPAALWLKQVRQLQCGLREVEHTPLLKILEWSETTHGRPMFESILNFQPQAWHELLRSQGEEWRNRLFSIRNQPNVPLWADSYGGKELVLKIGYDRARFEDDSIQRMLEHFKNLVCGLGAQPARKLLDVPLLGQEERHAVMVEWNRTESEFPREKCVPDLFEAQAASTPEALAVKCGGQQLNYRELNERANQLARHLKSLGVGPEVVVAVSLERSIDMIVAWLGVLKAGGAYLPIDPASPHERVLFMVKDSKAPVLLTQQSLRADLSAPQVICLDDAEQTMRNTQYAARFAWNDNPRRDLNAENLAYVIYTSGSTGQPKGVAIEHRGLMNLVVWHQNVYEVTAAERATQLAGPGFDAAVWELWPYLTAGASIHLPDEETRLSAEKLITWLQRERITLAFLPTPLAETVMELPWPQGMELRTLLTGGDRLHRPPPKTLPCWLTNHYGPTENSVVTTAAVIEPDCDSIAGPPIGCPIANTRVYILDGHLRPMPVGIPGELHISGVGLARGYLNQPELTAQKFIPNPFGTNEHSRLYKTGDLARYLPEGTIEFLGRVDQQVKLRGHRIELGEIEAVLGRHPAVKETIVATQPTRNGECILVAYVVAAQGQTPRTRDLRHFIKQTLPEYMVPAAFVFLDAIPLTRNGKVDRRTLPAVEEKNDDTLVAPRTTTEQAVADEWCEVLGRSEASVQENFFDLGGHSLQAARIMSRLRKRFSAELPLQLLFDAPTIEGLARKLELYLETTEKQLAAMPGGDPQGEGEPRPVALAPCQGQDLPLSFAQERLWFLEQLQPGLPLYNVPAAFEILGPLDPDRLSQCLGEIIRRHQPLHTSFLAVNGRPVAREQTVQSAPIPMVDLRSLAAAEREGEAQKISRAEAERPFALASGHLLRAKLLTLDDERHWLILTLHHIVSDGWSMGLFYRELSALYEAYSQGKDPSLPELTWQYADFARSQRESLAEAKLDAEVAYWKKQLAGPLPALNLPTDRPHAATQTFQGAMEGFVFPASLSSGLKTLARREDATLFMVLVAAFQALLHRYSGQEDILVGSPIAGRVEVESEALIGLFLNTQVLRGDLSGDPSFCELLARTRTMALQAYAHQEAPFEKLVEALQPDRDLSRSPLFQVMFVLQNEPSPPPQLAGLQVKALPVHNGTAKFDLTLCLEEQSGELCGSLEYNTNLFNRDTVLRMIGHYRTLLEAVLVQPESRVSALPLLTASERNTLLVEWNDTKTDFMQDRCVHQFFEDQAARTPEAVAVVFQDQQLTYEALNRRADALAAELRERGICPEDRVAICVPRSIEMIVGLLGILKAGGCYVPLDPSYPRERLRFMLEDSRAAVLLSQPSLAKELELELPGLATMDISASQTAADDLRSPSRQIPPGLSSANLAYVIYTSGSTGHPKGVMVTHRNLANFFAGIDRLLGTEPGVWLAVTSISFDISVLELFWTLARGFQVVIQPDDEVSNSSRANHSGEANGHRFSTLSQQMLRHGVTHVQCTPSLAGTLVSAPESVQAMRSLSKLLLGGEALPSALVQKLRPLVGGDILNMFGPTETTVWSTAYLLDKIKGEVLIGKPLANTEIYILDGRLQPVPIGVPGEIFIGGEGVTRGYLERPELTEAKFIADTFSLRPNARLYRTGDLGRYRADGHVEFLGRLDHQVKLRGHRIELGEIETILGRHPEVRQCAVRVWENGGEDKRLAAYVVPAQSSIPAAAELRRFLQTHLPSSMIPSSFITLDQLPLTPNGKINRQALPKPEATRAGVETAYVAPGTELENVIAGIWRDLLRVDKVGLQDNFFDLGGHSLLVVQAQASLRQALGIDLPVVKLFQYPTINALATFISNRDSRMDGMRERGRRKQAAYRRVPHEEHELMA